MESEDESRFMAGRVSSLRDRVADLRACAVSRESQLTGPRRELTNAAISRRSQEAASGHFSLCRSTSLGLLLHGSGAHCVLRGSVAPRRLQPQLIAAGDVDLPVPHGTCPASGAPSLPTGSTSLQNHCHWREHAARLLYIGHADLS